MDPVNLAYYALICGGLSLAAPQFGAAALRFAVGVVVGSLAAGALPLLRRWLGVG